MIWSSFEKNHLGVIFWYGSPDLSKNGCFVFKLFFYFLEFIYFPEIWFNFWNFFYRTCNKFPASTHNATFFLSKKIERGSFNVCPGGGLPLENQFPFGSFCESISSPRPSCPSSFDPQPSKFPSESSATEKEDPQSILTIDPDNPGISIGDKTVGSPASSGWSGNTLGSVVPNWSSLFAPNPKTVPPIRIKEWSLKRGG